MKPANTTPARKTPSPNVVDAVKRLGDNWRLSKPEFGPDERMTHDEEEFYVMAYEMDQRPVFRTFRRAGFFGMASV